MDLKFDKFHKDNLEKIKQVLFEFIPDLDICLEIINIVESEKQSTLNYYIDRHNNIFNKYIDSLKYDEQSGRKYYSYILNNKIIIAEKDRNIDFYKETGISYQVRNLLMDILNCPTKKADLITKDFTGKDLREENDKLYFLLTLNINNKMLK